MVKDIFPGERGYYHYTSNPRYLTNLNGTLFFAATDGTNGTQLWSSDGTSAGTQMVTDMNSRGSRYGGSYPTGLVIACHMSNTR